MPMKKRLNFTGNLSQVGESIFSKMSRLAREHQAINLSQGFPDFEVDPKLLDLCDRFTREGHNQYAPMAGAPALKQVLCELSNQQHGSEYQPEGEICITAGATQGIATALATVLREGDEVILFSPAYDSYIPMIELYGGSPITVKLSPEDYSIDWDQVKKVLNHRTRMIILNTPHNPSGSVWSDEDFKQLSDIVADSKILLLADEVYEHIVFNGAQHLSVRAYPTLRERAFVVGSLGKTVHVTGWKVGYVQAPEELMREFYKVHQFLVFSVNHPVQLALAEYLKDHDLASVGRFYEAKQRKLEQLLLEKTALKPLPTYGSYFQLVQYGHLSDLGDQACAEWLVKEIGVATIPLSPFYRDPTDHKVLRLCFAKNDQTLDSAANRLAKWS